MEVHLLGAESLHVDKRTDGHYGANSRFSQLNSLTRVSSSAQNIFAFETTAIGSSGPVNFRTSSQVVVYISRNAFGQYVH